MYVCEIESLNSTFFQYSGGKLPELRDVYPMIIKNEGADKIGGAMEVAWDSVIRGIRKMAREKLRVFRNSWCLFVSRIYSYLTESSRLPLYIGFM